ncbi:hypothetical protein FB45DRAFT_1000255 [Roridomyces roridus]|uniref:Uncharacterized protein n=1 Tax=Roridomyces roridus TaxID=1738132 RepID=A0AAD7C879_9AGAR|nr:hypothetical protein FB45DRAFT_1000255 [Roridomyces roridus]
MPASHAPAPPRPAPPRPQRLRSRILSQNMVVTIMTPSNCCRNWRWCRRHALALHATANGVVGKCREQIWVALGPGTRNSGRGRGYQSKHSGPGIEQFCHGGGTHQKEIPPLPILPSSQYLGTSPSPTRCRPSGTRSLTPALLGTLASLLSLLVHLLSLLVLGLWGFKSHPQASGGSWVSAAACVGVWARSGGIGAIWEELVLDSDSRVRTASSYSSSANSTALLRLLSHPILLHTVVLPAYGFCSHAALPALGHHRGSIQWLSSETSNTGISNAGISNAGTSNAGTHVEHGDERGHVKRRPFERAVASDCRWLSHLACKDGGCRDVAHGHAGHAPSQFCEYVEHAGVGPVNLDRRGVEDADIEHPRVLGCRARWEMKSTPMPASRIGNADHLIREHSNLLGKLLWYPYIRQIKSGMNEQVWSPLKSAMVSEYKVVFTENLTVPDSNASVASLGALFPAAKCSEYQTMVLKYIQGGKRLIENETVAQNACDSQQIEVLMGHVTACSLFCPATSLSLCPHSRAPGLPPPSHGLVYLWDSSYGPSGYAVGWRGSSVTWHTPFLPSEDTPSESSLDYISLPPNPPIHGPTPTTEQGPNPPHSLLPSFVVPGHFLTHYRCRFTSQCRTTHRIELPPLAK